MKSMRLKWQTILGFGTVLFIVMAAGCTERSPSSTLVTETSKPTVTSVSPSSPAVSFPPGRDLDFEVLVKSTGTTYKYGEEIARIYILTAAQSIPPEPLEWLEDYDRPAVLNANYQGNFAILVFNGYRGNIYSGMSILRAWRDGTTVYVLAHFNDFVPKATSLPAYSSQYEAVKIRKSQLGQLGEYTFKLLDEAGKERTSTTAEISP